MRVGETDTASAVDALYRSRLMERSGVERLRMACDMFDTAAALIVAGLPAQITADPLERGVAVLERMYFPERNDPVMTLAGAALLARSRRRGPE